MNMGIPQVTNNTFVKWLRPHQLPLQAIGKIFCWELVWNMALQRGKGLLFLHPNTCNNCVARRQVVEQHLRKDLSLQIRQIHRQELKQWKSNQLNAFLGNPSRWKDVRDYLPRPSGRRSVMYPHLDDFASMLEALFVGTCQPLQRPMRLTEPGWDLSELRFAVQRLKTGKCGDELGLTAELLKHAPEEFLNTLLTMYNNVLVTGERPESWCKTLFSMLPQKNKAITTCGLQTNCKHSFIIQNICICFTWTTGTVFGSRTAGRTTWISARTTTRRTPCHS